MRFLLICIQLLLITERNMWLNNQPIVSFKTVFRRAFELLIIFSHLLETKNISVISQKSEQEIQTENYVPSRKHNKANKSVQLISLSAGGLHYGDQRWDVMPLNILCIQHCIIGFQSLSFYLSPSLPPFLFCLCSCNPHSSNPPLLSPVCWNAVQLFNHSPETNQHLFGGQPRPSHCRLAVNTPAVASLTPHCPD